MSPIAIIGAVGGVALLLAGAAVVVQTARLDATQTREAAANKRADDNAAVARAMKENAERSAAIAADQAVALAKLDAAKLGITREIIRVPDSTACRDAPAIRATLDGLRRWPGGAPPAGAPGPAGGSDGAVRGAPATR